MYKKKSAYTTKQAPQPTSHQSLQLQQIQHILATLSPHLNPRKLKPFDYSTSSPQYSDSYLFKYGYFYGDSQCALSQLDYALIESYYTEKIEVFWSNLDAREKWEAYHFSVRVTFVKKEEPQSEGQRVYVYAQIVREGLQVYIRQQIADNNPYIEQDDLHNLKAKGFLRFIPNEYFPCQPIHDARYFLTCLINCKELSGYGGQKHCVSFVIWVVEEFSEAKVIWIGSKLETERILAKYKGKSVIGIGWKFVIAKRGGLVQNE
ncbi:hypothetical protein FGO68_gene198 [Halteria grandinella]|uniref:Uncharacterized protein n=1 Tax=Halteria grandinella TaxID=5974 RepID=A0A8J8NKT3_HALGN|nr:hypothetical protein FGO68_gene198 [Halteria grandinella]